MQLTCLHLEKCAARVSLAKMYDPQILDSFGRGFLVLQGWICNSSICMTKKGLKPTGIAIFDAQQQGFRSVAHHLQVDTTSTLPPLGGSVRKEQRKKFTK